MPPKSGRGGRGGARAAAMRAREQNGASSAERSNLYKPRPKYPAVVQPKVVKLRKNEQATLEYVRRFRKQMQDGPLYTVLDTNARIGKPGELAGVWSLASTNASAVKEVNPFEGFPTYSSKYKKPKRPLPKLETRNYIQAFFPEELHQFIDPSVAGKGRSQAAKRRKLPNGKLADDDDIEEEEEEDLLGDEEDDDFSEDDDDDDGDDYNAERYFENGEDDIDDEGGGGGDYE